MTSKQEALEWYECYFGQIYGGYIPNLPHHNTIRAALTEAPSANTISLTAFNKIKEKLGKAAYIFGTHFAEGDATGEYNDGLIALNESILQLNAITEAPQGAKVDDLKRDATIWYDKKFSKGITMPTDRQVMWGYIDHLTTHYDLVKKEG